MILLSWLIFTALFLSILVSGVGHLLMLKSEHEIEKPSPFECGFNTKDNNWTPFSMQFFMSALIFLVFDIELIILFPFVMALEWKLSLLSVTNGALFLIILSAGFFLEWAQKMLEWSK